MTSRIVANERERVGDWVRERAGIGESWGEWYQALGLERDGALVAGVVFNQYSVGNSISMHVASDGSRRWMTREYLRAVFDYPFRQLGLRRVTGYVPAKNADARRFDEHIGFKQEGVLRRALPDDDLVIYGMLKEECRWHGR